MLELFRVWHLSRNNLSKKGKTKCLLVGAFFLFKKKKCKDELCVFYHTRRFPRYFMNLFGSIVHRLNGGLRKLRMVHRIIHHIRWTLFYPSSIFFNTFFRNYVPSAVEIWRRYIFYVAILCWKIIVVIFITASVLVRFKRALVNHIKSKCV